MSTTQPSASASTTAAAPNLRKRRFPYTQVAWYALRALR